jgi:hypothetical protein
VSAALYDVLLYDERSRLREVLRTALELGPARIAAMCESHRPGHRPVAIEPHDPDHNYPAVTTEAWVGGSLLFTSLPRRS